MSNIIQAYTKPIAANFTIYNNAGTSAVTDVANGLCWYVPSDAAISRYTLLVQDVPAAPYTATAHIDYYPQLPYTRFGLCWFNSSSTKFSNLIITTNSTYLTSAIHYQDWTNYTTNYAATVLTTLYNAKWFRISDNGTNRICWLSRDGINWKQVYSVSNTDFVTPDKIGFCINSRNNNCFMKINSWKVENV